MPVLKITAMSDTHNHHEAFELPGGDILLHSGDATGRGSIAEMGSFLKWYGEQDYAHRIFVPGNHDWICETNPSLILEMAQANGVILLNDSGITVEGIKIWGSAVQPWFYDWAFNRRRGEDIKKHWDLIPEDTEILVTHGPVYGLLDKVKRDNLNVGCEDLLVRIREIDSIKLHICGHIHEGRGHINVGDKLFVNASSLNYEYKIETRTAVSIEKEHDTGLYIVK